MSPEYIWLTPEAVAKCLSVTMEHGTLVFLMQIVAYPAAVTCKLTSLFFNNFIGEYWVRTIMRPSDEGRYILCALMLVMTGPLHIYYYVYISRLCAKLWNWYQEKTYKSIFN